MDMMVYIGRNLKHARYRAGLTQAELAQKADTTQTTVARIERDAVQPEIRTIRKLARALDITIAELLGD